MTKQLKSFLNLYLMRRHSAGRLESARWVFGLLWRNHQTNQRNKGRAEFDRTIHHQL